MALSGWFVALVAVGVVPIVLTGQPVVLALWIVLVVVLGALDLVLAGSPRSVTLSRNARYASGFSASASRPPAIELRVVSAPALNSRLKNR